MTFIVRNPVWMYRSWNKLMKKYRLQVMRFVALFARVIIFTRMTRWRAQRLACLSAGCASPQIQTFRPSLPKKVANPTACQLPEVKLPTSRMSTSAKTGSNMLTWWHGWKKHSTEQVYELRLTTISSLMWTAGYLRQTAVLDLVNLPMSVLYYSPDSR